MNNPTNIYRLSLFFAMVLIGVMSCQKQASLTSKYLIGKSVIEVVDMPSAHYTDTSITTFINDSFYKRSMGIYIQREGKYEVINDTLKIHYGCQSEKCDESKCAIQSYIMDTKNKLHLVHMTGNDGKVEDIGDTPFDKVLEFTDY